MTELFLIAHKVRGEPAFDVAVQIECPLCCNGYIADDVGIPIICSECDGTARWWIIPTSGHRAYPYWSFTLERLMEDLISIPPLPASLPDHYPTSSTHKPKLDLLALMPKPAPIRRRV